MCPGISLGGGRFGVGLAKMGRMAQEKEAMEKKEGVLHTVCVSEILEVPLGFWYLLSGRAVETWQWGCLVSSS